MSGWQAIGPDVFVFADTCQVYALRDRHRALLIDLGSGAALDQLREIGVSEVAEIWFTHAQREQCQGYPIAAAMGLVMRFPKAAQAWVDAAARDDFARLSPCHLAYPHRPHPPQPMPDARFDLTPLMTMAWGPFDLKAVAAPGHLDHQLAFLVEGPGGPYLCSGDAMHSAGKVHEAYSLEHDHYTGAGARQAADTLCALRNLRPAHLCPSHGPVLSAGIADALNLTIDRLRQLADLKDTCVPGRPAVQRLVRPQGNTFLQISEHLWLWNNSYFLCSDDGPVLMVDVQMKLPESFHADYRATFGERPIEVALITHIHCDHVMGVEDLRATWPLSCWALDRLAGAIEQPYDYARPWLHNNPTKVDRPLRDGVPVRWHEYELTPYWFPGQTDLHACYHTTIDSHAALLAGDNFYPPQQWGGTGGLCGLNGGHPRLWRQSAELVLRLGPDWILASHLQPFPFRREDFEAVVAWSHDIEALMRDLAPDGCLERHHSPHLFHAMPYVQPLGEVNPVKFCAWNPYPHPIELTVAAVTPAGVAVDGEPRQARLEPGESTGLGFIFRSSPDLAGMRLVTFDLTVDGERWGEVVECYLRGPGTYIGQE